MSTPTNLKVSEPTKGVLTITLHRPEALNALNTKLLEELADLLDEIQSNPEVGAVVITGSSKAFAAGADVREMATLDAVGVLRDPRVDHWKRITAFKKPLIAAVNGFCLGGGCELAMHADIIIAGEEAKFGQPEIKLGIMPGAGGTQRLLRAVGKSMAMQMVLTGEPISAQQAMGFGLISEITIPETTVERAQKVAQQIARHAPIAVEMAKDSVLKAFDTDLASGLLYERKAFTLLAATEDRNEGINAFIEKRKPAFKGC
ncbi:2,3-dehydroadipyl-CoA hydratase PaaF [Neptuniibacter caesariensis]|uniref:Enoyl-CoA hydratase/isomerase n=1 Tax=Neptuniibacter caesariensis TaxID=207954 RepID=A0A7U8C1Y3_NEPCE|nr:2,3-dehydroadipyl-CoA hydratase PaaF [Neptuniibacter caesariensis]EAR60003.1 enoyl-CoA hydratase/isomerase [Oceanospirillum sp. MED92] [Neptuniibacter caesariensis]